MDFMHCMFLGWQQYLYGSVFHLLVFKLMGGTPLANLSDIQEWILSFQRLNDVQYPYRHRLDKLSMFQKKSGYPRLRGRAADIMGLDTAMLGLWKEHMEAGNVVHKRIRLLLDLNVRVAKILHEFSPKTGHFKVPEPAYGQLRSMALDMAQLHAQVLEHFQNEGTKVFNITSKTHFALHSLLLAQHIHPALVWCFKGEAMMRRSSAIWKSCVDGSRHWQVSMKAALKYRTAFTLFKAQEAFAHNA